MSDQVSTESIRVSHEVAEGSSCIGSSFLFLVSEKFNQKRDTRLQMLIENVVVEPSITNSEAGELSGVSIRVLTALDGSSDQPKLEQLLVEESSMSAQVSDQIAYLSSD